MHNILDLKFYKDKEHEKYIQYKKQLGQEFEAEINITKKK